jgi:formate dehydrogenase iron-sulfur subunit
MNKQKGILFDSTLCVGCGECYHACKKQNNNTETNKDYLKDHLAAETYTVVESYGDAYTRKMCMHCAQPACVSVCPVGAFEKTEIGAVTYESDKCIGCRYCMQACPHHIPRYEWKKNNPRIKKCILCYEKISKGEGTACSEACPSGATLFGSVDELKKEAWKRLKENPDIYYPEIFGDDEAGGSNIMIIASVPFDKLGFSSNIPKKPLPEYTAKALDKIPGVVGIGSVFLTGMYWLTKRKNQIAKEENILEKEQ